MSAPPDFSLKRHFDELADQAPPASDTLVTTARASGDRHRRRQIAIGAGAGAVALTLMIAIGATQPWSSDPAATTAGHAGSTSPSQPDAPHLAGASWRLLQGASGGYEVEHYDTIKDLFAAAPLTVRGAVTHVELGPVINDPQVDEPYRDLLLTITPSEMAGPATDSGPVVVQLGPLFGAEANDRVKEMSTGSGSLIGDEAVWALRPRMDAPTYRPLTSDSVFIRNGDALLTPHGMQTPISDEARSTSWLQLLRLAGLND